MGKTAIEWAEATWNPVEGCTKVSTGCRFCYAERIHPRLFGSGPGSRPFSQVVTIPSRLSEPLHWWKPRQIFVCSRSDLFHKDVPDSFIAEVMNTMDEAKRHQFLVLTKRPERMWSWCSGHWTQAVPPHIWLGVSCENQEQADKRIPLLLQTPAAVRFLSLEPLLGPINLDRYLWAAGDDGEPAPRNEPHTPLLHWVICGGESGGPPERALVEKTCPIPGPGIDYLPRLDPIDWVRQIRDQCQAAGVPFFFKQFGGPTPKSGGRILDGRTWDEYPDAIR